MATNKLSTTLARAPFNPSNESLSSLIFAPAPVLIKSNDSKAFFTKLRIAAPENANPNAAPTPLIARKTPPMPLAMDLVPLFIPLVSTRVSILILPS